MITQSEASMTTGQYSDFQAASGDAAALIKLQRLGPVWSDPGHTSASAGTGLKARVFDTEIVRVFNSGSGILAAEKLADESGGDQDWLSVGVHSNVVVNGDIKFDLVTDDATLRLFYYNDADRIAYSDCSDLGVGFGEPTVIDYAVGDLRHLTATTLTTVHYITLTAQANRRFHVGNYSDSWYFTNSDILYPFPINSMSAIQLSDGTDVIALAATLPPLIGSRIIGVEVTQDVKTVQSILIFLHNNGRWSDHYIVDTIDNIPVAPARSNVRLNYYNDTVFLSYNRRGGSDAVNYAKCTLSRSSTGKFFELPELIDLDTPVVIVPRDDYLYAIGKDTLRSPTCIFGAQTPVEQGVTDLVTKTAASAGEIRQTTYEMANGAQSDGSYELDTTLADLSATERMQMVCDLGYWVSGEQLLVRVGTEDVVTVDEIFRMPVHGISVAGMDRLGRLNRIVSDHASEFPGMEIGRDPLTDPTGTGWGGMRHLASYKPSWKAEGGVLSLVSNNKEGLVASTFVTDTLNGVVQIGMSLGYGDQNEYAGIAFRVHDKDTLYYLAYHPDEDQVQLYKRIGSNDDFTDTLIDYVDTSGWGWSVAEGTYFYLRAWAYYGRIYLHKSDDGITWSTVLWNGSSQTYTELPGQTGYSTQYTMWSGKFGLLGYGYSDEDTNPWTPSPWLPPAIPLGPTSRAVLNMSTTKKVVTFDIDADSVVWYDADPDDDITGTLVNCIASSDGQAYIVTTNAAWYCSDLTAAINGSISWTKEVEIVAGDFRSTQVVNGGPVLVIRDSPGVGYGGDWGLLKSWIAGSRPLLTGVQECSDEPQPPCREFNVHGGLRALAPDGTLAGGIYALPTHYGDISALAEDPPECLCGEGDASRVDAGFAAISQSLRYIVNTGGELKDGSTGTRGKGGTWPLTVLDTSLNVDAGVLEDLQGRYYYVKKTATHDLYRNGIEFANSDIFDIAGAPRNGWLFQILANDDILWQVDNLNVSYIGQHKLLVMYDESEDDWVDKTGNLWTAIGEASWVRSRAFYAFGILEDLL